MGRQESGDIDLAFLFVQKSSFQLGRERVVRVEGPQCGGLTRSGFAIPESSKRQSTFTHLRPQYTARGTIDVTAPLGCGKHALKRAATLVERHHTIRATERLRRKLQPKWTRQNVIAESHIEARAELNK